MSFFHGIVISAEFTPLQNDEFWKRLTTASYRTRRLWLDLSKSQCVAMRLASSKAGPSQLSNMKAG
jgi:hypothetical protein